MAGPTPSLSAVRETLERVLSRSAARISEVITDYVRCVRSWEEFQELKRSSRIFVVMITASWCVPCRLYEGVFRSAARHLLREGLDAVFAVVDADTVPHVADAYAVERIPVTLILVEGHVIEELVGALPLRTLVEKIKSIVKSVVG